MRKKLLLCLLIFNTVYGRSIFNFLKPGMLVFDVGAHIGNKTQEYLHHGCQVVCFEPNPYKVKILKNRFYNNQRVIIKETALGDATEPVILNVCSRMDVISTCTEKWMTGRFSNNIWDLKIKVQMTTLDTMIEKYGVPDYCKIDVEGFELAVLKGLSRPIKSLSFEFTKEFVADARDCLRHLLKIGFKSFYSDPLCQDTKMNLFRSHSNLRVNKIIL